MARGVRFELTTHGLEGRCSIQLSYPRKINYTYQGLKFSNATLDSCV